MTAKASRYRREAEAALAELEEAELMVARDFLEFLRAKKPDRATLEILGSVSLKRDIAAARADLREGNLSRFKPWEDVKRRRPRV